MKWLPKDWITTYLGKSLRYSSVNFINLIRIDLNLTYILSTGVLYIYLKNLILISIYISPDERMVIAY